MEALHDPVSALVCDDVLKIILDYCYWFCPVIYNVSQSLRRLCRDLPIRASFWESKNVAYISQTRPELLHQLTHVDLRVLNGHFLKDFDYTRCRFLHTYEALHRDCISNYPILATKIGPQIKTLNLLGMSSSFDHLIAGCAKIEKSSGTQLFCNVETVLLNADHEPHQRQHMTRFISGHLPVLKTLHIISYLPESVQTLLSSIDVSKLESMYIALGFKGKTNQSKQFDKMHFARLRWLSWPFGIDSLLALCEAPRLERLDLASPEDYADINRLLSAYPQLKTISSGQVVNERSSKLENFESVKTRLQDKQGGYHRPFQYLMRIPWYGLQYQLAVSKCKSQSGSHYSFELDSMVSCDLLCPQRNQLGVSELLSSIVPHHPQIQVLISLGNLSSFNDWFMQLKTWATEHEDFVYIVP